MNDQGRLATAIEGLEALEPGALTDVAAGLVRQTIVELQWHLDLARRAADLPRDYVANPPPCSACRGRGTITPVDLDEHIRTCPRCGGSRVEPQDREPVHAYDEGFHVRCGAPREAVVEAAGGPSWRVTYGRGTRITCADGVTCIRCLTATVAEGVT